MSNRLTFWLAGIVLGAMLLLFFIDYLELPTASSSHSFISLTDVDGVGIIHKGVEYTLNFEEQNTLIDSLNRAVHIERPRSIVSTSELPFSGIKIYPFKGDAIELKLVGISSDQECIFKLTNAGKTTYLKETTVGQLLNMLKNTYD